MLNRYLCSCQHKPSLSRPTHEGNQASATLVYLPILAFLAFFVTSRRVHLDLQTLNCSFLFLFQMTCYIKLPLLLSRAQIKQLGAFILYLTTNLPSLNCLERCSFSILQHQFKHGMIQITLLDHPLTSRTIPKLFTNVFVHTNMEPLHHQS